jgi:phosphoribosyl-AMP cyclohydrolase
MIDTSFLKFDDNGLIAAIACDAETNEVLMLGYMNDEALRLTAETGRLTFWSRSRRKLWIKGETSGHTAQVKWLRVDCDGDALLVGVELDGAMCHECYRNCFFREWRDGNWEVIAPRLADPQAVYGKK